MTTRCTAAESCSAPAIVKILIPFRDNTPACEVHGAALLAATGNALVHPLEGVRGDHAIAVWYRAQALKEH
ncbi:hypothetical protein ACIHFE_18825 [Streptomyces sp. NPDC052396]|uniref:hypothetical protein n=1 Tax=Streptomyces sp. NPDC052396 TaxID=3365689 RepID=UPI0037D030BF